MADFIVNVKANVDTLTPQLRAQAAAAKQAEAAQKSAGKAASAANKAAAADAKKAADAQIKEALRAQKEQLQAASATAAGQRKLDEQIAKMRDKTARDLDRQAARDEARDARVADRKAKGEELANARGMAARAKAEGRALSDEEVSQRVRRARVDQANKARVDAARKAAGVEVDGNRRADASMGSLVGNIKGAAVAYAGLRGSVAVMNALGDATRAAADQQKRQADEYIRYREAQGEIRGMDGKTANREAVVEAAKFGVDTGLSSGESKAFRTAFKGSGDQYAKRFGEKEYGELQTRSAQLAVAKNIDPATVGDLAGTTAGAKDYGKLGDKAAETALEDINQSMSILGKGRGDNAVLARQLSMTTAALTNEDELKGIFKSQQEAAIALSTMAEFNPEAAFVHLQASKKGLRDFNDDKAKPLLDEAGITPSTSYFDALEKLGPIVQAKAKARGDGTKTEDILKEYFEDERTVRGIGTAINKGIGPGGIFEQRRNYIANEMAPGSAQRLIDESRNDPGGNVPERIASAKLEQANVLKGSRTAELETMLKAAEAELIDKGGIDTRATNITDVGTNILNWSGIDFGLGRVGVGTTDARQRRKYDAVAEQLREAARQAGVGGAEGGGVFDNGTQLRSDYSEEEVQRRYNAIIDKIKAKGFNPMTGERLPGAAAGAAPGPQAAIGGGFGGGPGGIGGLVAGALMGASPGGVPEVFPDDDFAGSGSGGAAETNRLLGLMLDMMTENQRYIRMATGGGRPSAPPPPPLPPRLISAPVGR